MHFGVKNVVDQKQIEIKYFPTEQMLADVHTKASQGSAFTVLRAVLAGYLPSADLYKRVNISAKERVVDIRSKNMTENSHEQTGQNNKT